MTLRRFAVALTVSLLAGTLWVAAATPAKNPPKASPPAPETRSTEATPVVPPPPPPPADAPEPPDDHGGGNDRIGVGEDITIPAGRTHNGDVVCVRGHVTIEGQVNGTVTVVGGSLDLSGTVNGDVVTVLSRATLAPSAVVEGQLVNVAGSLERSGATVSGQVVNIPVGFPVPGLGTAWSTGWGIFSGIFFWWKLFAIFLFFVCALLLTALVPDRIRLISEETPLRLFTAFLAGLVGYMVFGMVQIFLAVTIIGIPLVFLLYLVFTVLQWLAMCGVFHQIGSRMGRSLGREMSLLGGILLGLAPFALLRFVPFCVGWSIWFLVEILGFGCLILTRVGTRRSSPFVVVTPPPAAQPPATTLDPGSPPIG
jgi:hypothetical protein